MKIRRILFPLFAILLVVAGCNSTESVMQPSPGGTTGSAPAGSENAAQRFQLAPVVGAPLEKVTVMTRRLSTQARASGLTLVGSDKADGTHILKGYFSAFTEGSSTTVVYVWDVLDTSGNRLHRFQGQEVSQVPGGTDWDGVSDAAMEAVADQTIQALVSWAGQG